MQVILRQAHKIVEKLLRLQRETEVTPVHNVDSWTLAAATPQEILANVQSAFARLQASTTTAISRQISIIQNIGEIRRLIQQANERNGINDLVATRKVVLEQIAVYRRFALNAVETPLTAEQSALKVTQMLQRENARVSEPIQYAVDFPTAGLIQTLEGELEKIDEALSQKNATVTVTLSSVVVAFLKEAGIS